jgi:hypothetical protein
METWEKILRHELNELIPDGLYTIGKGKFRAQTGKGGYIEYRVELCRALFFDTTENPTTYEFSVVDNIEDETINFSPINPTLGFICECKEPHWKETPSRYICDGCRVTVSK